MELNLNLCLSANNDKEEKARMRVLEVEKKRKWKEFQPTLEQVFYSGYDTPTGKRKEGIFQMKLTDSDRKKLERVKEAIDKGLISVGVDDMKKFTKTHALRLYQQLLSLEREQEIQKLIKGCPSNYFVVNTQERLEWLTSLLKNESLIAVDTETTGLDYIDTDKIVGISLTLPIADVHVYVPIGHVTGEPQLSETVALKELQPFLEDKKIKKVLHNAKFDIHMFLKHGIKLAGLHFDTMVGMVLLNENEPSYALKNLATKYGKFFNFDDKSATFEELFGKVGFENVPFTDGKGGIGVGAVYACKDTHLTYEFYRFIEKQLDRLPQLRTYFHDIEKPLIEISVHMEQNGFLIDFTRAEKYKNELNDTLERLEKELFNEFGGINVNSPIQLAQYLYDVQGLRDISRSRSTEASVLKELGKEFPPCLKLLEYRDIKKLLSTYIQPLPEKVAKRDGRLHGQFSQTGTVTGRFSSNSPNLQNLPKEARKIIRADDGKLIIGIDFSQIEPRVLAHMSQDEKFALPYLTGRDPYSEIASNVFNKPIEECGDGSIYRKQSKVILLGVMYGMSAASLADMLNIELKEAEKFINDFYKSYPKVAEFVETNKQLIAKQGYVTTMFGRKRRFIGHQQRKQQLDSMRSALEKRYGTLPENIWAMKNIPYDVKRKYADIRNEVLRAERQATNFIIQGTAAEIMKIAMIKLYDYLTAKGWKMLATVHDEVLMEVDESITLKEVEELENIMINAVKLSVPIKVDTEIMRYWGEGVSKKEFFNL